MELTDSWKATMPDAVRTRYDFLETRDAAAILQATNPEQHDDLCAVLASFALTTEAILMAGGNETLTAGRLTRAFRERGWHEERAVRTMRTYMQQRGSSRRSDDGAIRAEMRDSSTGYFIDNVKGKVVLDVEWNAKDGNLERDLAMYCWLYEQGFVSVAILITREHKELREFGRKLRREAGQPDARVKAWLDNTSTTNSTKLAELLRAGNAGGCPILGVAITSRTWDGTAAAAAQ